MKKREINVADHTCEILKALKTGVLLTSCADGRVNTMTISWGMLGIEWNYPLFITVVREGRFTRSLLDKNGQFTINIPRADSPMKALAVCGTKSGRDIDKIARLGLTLVDGEEVSVPAIKEFPLTLECKVAAIEHGTGGFRVVGEIVNVIADEKILDAKDKIDPEKLNAFVFDQFQNGYYRIGEKVGQAWESGAALMSTSKNLL